MNNPKPIRRHSKPRRVLMNAGYYTVKGLRVPVIGILTLAFALFFLVFIASLFCIMILIMEKVQGRYESGGFLNLTLPTCGIVALFFGGGAFVMGRIALETANAPVGTILNPTPPKVNEILPDTEVLVRASIASDAAQKETLLRPAAATADLEPQTLLRASGKAE